MPGPHRAIRWRGAALPCERHDAVARSKALSNSAVTGERLPLKAMVAAHQEGGGGLAGLQLTREKMTAAVEAELGSLAECTELRYLEVGGNHLAAQGAAALTPALLRAIRAGDQDAVDEYSAPQRTAMLALSPDFGR